MVPFDSPKNIQPATVWTICPVRHDVRQNAREPGRQTVEVLECLHLALGIEPPTPALRGAKNRRKSQ